MRRIILLIVLLMIACSAWALPPYENVIQDESGNKLAGVKIYVYKANSGSVYPTDGTLAALYSDAGGVTGIDNPVTTTSLGRFSFFTRNGMYDLYVYSSSLTPYTLEDVPIFNLVTAGDNRVEPSVFGAIPDDGFDDTEAIQEAADSASVTGSVLSFGPGTYKIAHGGVNIKSAVVDLGQAVIEWTPTTSADACFYSAGTATKIADWTENIIGSADFVYEGGSYFEYDGAQILDGGELVYLIADSPWTENTYRYNKTSTGWAGQVNEVVAGSGDYAYYLTDGCLLKMNAADNDGMSAFEITPTTPQIIGGTILITGGDIAANAIWFNMTEGAQVIGTRFEAVDFLASQYTSMIRLVHCYGTQIKDCYIDLAHVNTYGIVIGGLSYNTQIDGIIQSGGRSCVTTTFSNFPYDDWGSTASAVEAAGGFYRVCGVGHLMVSNTLATGIQQSSSAFNTHPCGRYATFSNCKAVDCVTGFGARQSYTTFSNCEYIGYGQSGATGIRHGFWLNSQNAIDGAGGDAYTPTPLMVSLYGPSGSEAVLMDSDNNIIGAEEAHWGGTRSLVGNRIVDCTVTGADIAVRLEGTSDLVIDGLQVFDEVGRNVALEYLLHCTHMAPKYWDADYTYTPGDRVRDYDTSTHKTYECKVASGPHSDHGSYEKPFDDSGESYWEEVDGRWAGPNLPKGKLFIRNLNYYQDYTASALDLLTIYDDETATSSRGTYEQVVVSDCNLGYTPSPNAAIKVEAFEMSFAGNRMGYNTGDYIYNWSSTPAGYGIRIMNDASITIDGSSRSSLMFFSGNDIAATTKISFTGSYTQGRPSYSVHSESYTHLFTPISSINAPGEGAVFYDSDDNKLNLYNGSSWEEISSGGAKGDDSAYDESTWNGDTDAPSKNAVRDKIVLMDAVSATSSKNWAFNSLAGASGDYYFGGYYDHNGTANDFDPATTHGTANESNAAHFYVVLGATAVDQIGITITGTSITDAGVRTTSDTEDITIPNATAAGAYYETALKWLGQVAVETVSGTAKICDFGYVKYWDCCNVDFTLTGLDATWLAGANETGLEIELFHHKATGWTYTGTGATPPSTSGLKMSDAHSTDNDISSGSSYAWKRAPLSIAIDGADSEGLILMITTTTNNAIQQGNFSFRVQK